MFFVDEHLGLEIPQTLLFLIVSKMNCPLFFAFILWRWGCFSFNYASGAFSSLFFGGVAVDSCCQLAVFLYFAYGLWGKRGGWRESKRGEEVRRT